MFDVFFRGRYSVLFSFLGLFLFCSFLIRFGLVLCSLPANHFSFGQLLGIYGVGLFFDLGTGLFLVSFYNFYLLILPEEWTGRVGDRVFTYGCLLLMFSIVYFSFFAEITFWLEFESRFSFIAVSDPVYAFEVLHKLNRSYLIAFLLGGVFGLVGLSIWLMGKVGCLESTLQEGVAFRKRFIVSASLFFLTVIYALFIDNDMAEYSNNRYQNELSKAGIYSFFAAFKGTELQYSSGILDL